MSSTDRTYSASAASATTAAEALAFAGEHKAEMVDLKFVDLPGTWQHMTLPLTALDEGDFETGLGFDGSSIRGFQEIHESDMLLMPDATTAFIDPYYTRTTLSLICSIADPVLGEPYSRDPRFIAQKAEKYLVQSGIADVAYFGPEAEFFVFDHLAYEQSEHRAFYEIDSKEGFWNTGEVDKPEPNLAYKLRQKEGYFPVPPSDSLANLRSEMVMTMESLGIRCEFHHHEVSSGGQGEIDMRFQPLLKMADQIMIYKYLVKSTAAAAGKVATFMPKPIFQENGSGMHVHQSLWKDGEPLMYSKGRYADLSELAIHYIGGLLEHASALMAFCAPTTNSYRRLVPGFEAPVNLVYSARNRSAQRACECRCTTKRRRPSESSFARPTRPPTRTSLFPRWCSRGSTGSSADLTPARRSTLTSTSCRRKRSHPSGACPARSTRAWTRSKPTTRSCSRMTCSRLI